MNSPRSCRRVSIAAGDASVMAPSLRRPWLRYVRTVSPCGPGNLSGRKFPLELVDHAVHLAPQARELGFEVVQARERRVEFVLRDERQVRERGVGDELLAAVGPVQLGAGRVGRRQTGVDD